ncbi:hypothetical protein UVI_02051540 [Ustilaginoidea virens]|uniref:C2H2-type domain-containing protein n=1 Tax=Ustilaginoidea virens TaxID=1159556 RepID=A0A1B5KXT1_USTVR|nr:hypothetical protein UVI_02051540 [Ustilaginoidea virens]
MYECETCTREFYTSRSCSQHMNDTGHWAARYDCDTCSKVFLSRRAADQHMDATDHWAPQHPCETCSLVFRSEEDAERHMDEKGHYEHYCRPCRRSFSSANALKMHLNSSTHRGKKVGCPFCGGRYTSASGLGHHLETASCPNAPQLNRETIFRLIRERDPGGLITNKLIGWKEDRLGPYEATDHAYNGDSWECYICHRTFSTSNGLNQHLNSPTHKQKIYHCPNKRGGCAKQFVSLAGLFNHLESEECSFMRFEAVQSRVDNLVNGRGMIAF